MLKRFCSLQLEKYHFSLAGGCRNMWWLGWSDRIRYPTVHLHDSVATSCLRLQSAGMPEQFGGSRWKRLYPKSIRPSLFLLLSVWRRAGHCRLRDWNVQKKLQCYEDEIGRYTSSTVSGNHILGSVHEHDVHEVSGKF